MASKCIIPSGEEMHHGCLRRKSPLSNPVQTQIFPSFFPNSNPFNNNSNTTTTTTTTTTRFKYTWSTTQNRCALGWGKKRKFHSTLTPALWKTLEGNTTNLAGTSWPGPTILCPQAWAHPRGNRAHSTHSFPFQVQGFVFLIYSIFILTHIC